MARKGPPKPINEVSREESASNKDGETGAKAGGSDMKETFCMEEGPQAKEEIRGLGQRQTAADE